MAAKSSAFIQRTTGDDLRFHPAGGGEVADLGGGLVGIPVHYHWTAEDDTLDFSGFVNYNGAQTVHADTTDFQIVITDTFVSETLTGLERISDADLAAGHHYPGRWLDPGSDTYPAATLVDEVGSLDGTISGATWTGGVSPTSPLALTIYHAKNALVGRSEVGSVGRSAGIVTGQPGQRLDVSGLSWPSSPIAHVTRGHPSTTTSDIILQIIDSFEGGFYVTPAGVVTFGRILDPFLLAADHEIPYLDLTAGDPSASWNSTESEDPPLVLDMPYGAVSFTESSADLLVGATVRDRNTWKFEFRILSLPVPSADDLFPLAPADPLRETAWWADEIGARDEVRRLTQILRFRRLEVKTEVGFEQWGIVHPVTGKALLPFDTIEITSPYAEHLASGGTVKAVLFSAARDLGSQTVKLDLRMIRVG